MTPKTPPADLEDLLRANRCQPSGSSETPDPDTVRQRLIEALQEIDNVDELLLLERIAAIADDPFSEVYAMAALLDLGQHIARCHALSLIAEEQSSAPFDDTTSR